MKNKHLLLLFACTLLLGLLARRFPWSPRKGFGRPLIELDTALVGTISVARPGGAELLLQRTEAGWVVSEEGLNVPLPPQESRDILAALVAIQSSERIKSSHPDSTGLLDPLAVEVRSTDGHTESFAIGTQQHPMGNAHTYLKIPRLNGIYLVQTRLRELLERRATDFRRKTALQFNPEGINGLGLGWPERDSMAHFFPTDSAQVWGNDLGGRVPRDSVLRWLRLLQRLNGGPFADYFDDSRAAASEQLDVSLFANGALVASLRFFHLRPPEMPEAHERFAKMPYPLQPWVLHSSQNPHNFFALGDTLLVKQILRGISY
jgi:hypothetical protein